MIKFLHFNNSYLMNSSSNLLRKKYQSRTTAVETADPASIRKLALDFTNTKEDQELIYNLKVGVSFVHPNDRYEKKVGREQSTEKMEDIPLKVVAVNITPTHIFVRLQTFKGMDLNLRLNKQTNFSTVTGSMSGGY